MWQTQKYLALNITIGILNKYIKAISENAKLDFYKIVKSMKQKYYKNVIDNLSHQNIF